MALQSWHRTLPQCVVLGWSCGSCSDVGYGFPEFTRYIQHPLSLPVATPPFLLGHALSDYLLHNHMPFIILRTLQNSCQRWGCSAIGDKLLT